MKTKSLGRTLWFVLILQIVPSFGSAQETNHAADKFDLVQPVAVPVAEATPQFEATKAKAEKGDAQAQYNLADCYASGRGVAQDNVEALKWYREAAEGNDAEAQWILGSCYADGQGVAQDYVQAYKWFTLAAARGETLAKVARNNVVRSMTPDQIAEGERLSAEFTARKETSSSTPEFVATKAKAETGDAQAQYNLGLCYAGTAEDYVEAVKWFRRAAEQNYAHAQCALGVCYDSGKGVAKDAKEAGKWFHIAAAQGDAEAEYDLGNCYANGQDMAKNEVEAVKWYRKAAEQNDAPAQFALGGCYAFGQGVAKNEVEAVKWVRKAAEQNYARAQCFLGVCYVNGLGVPKDYTEAVKWIRKAVEQNYSRAQLALGNCYDYGLGVAQDVQAYKWYDLAAAQGDSSAIKDRNRIAASMTPDQIAEGKRLSAEFISRK